MARSIDQRLAEFFDAFARLAESPTSSTARQEVILQGASLAGAFSQVADRLAAAQSEADGRVRATVEQVNTLARRIASLNKALGSITREHGEALQLQDQAKLALEQLSRLTSVEVLELPSGGFDVSVAGRPLVAGDDAFALTVSARPGTGFADVVASDGSVLTGQFESGALGGLIQARDVLVPRYQASLDDLAFSVATEVNGLHASGFDLNGNAGEVFFQAPAAVAGAAASLTVSPALRASGGEALVAASDDPAAAGDNGAARALAAPARPARAHRRHGDVQRLLEPDRLHDRPRLAGGADEQRNRAELVRQVETLRDSASGVSLDEEAANLMRFQRAYEANARFFQTVDRQSRRRS